MSLKICFLGDIMPGGVLHNKPSGVSAEVKEYLSGFDLRIGTLECAIGDTPDFDPVKMSLKQDVIYAPNINLNKLKELGINCVSLANNHAFDLGANGLENTIAQLDKLGIAHCGAGRNYEEASEPVVIECKGLRIGIIGLCDNQENTVGYVPVATESCPGMNSIGCDFISQIKSLRRRVDFLYVMIHWGEENTFWPSSYMLDIAKKCVDAGADGIIGGHQHRVQPLVTYRNKPIFLGLGNFLFPPRYLRPPRPMYYPAEEEDTSQFPITDSYPWVETPTYKIWKRLGRIGACGLIEIDSAKNQISDISLFRMNDNHAVIFADKSVFKFSERILLSIINVLIPNSGNDIFLRAGIFVRRGCRYLHYKFSRLFGLSK